MRQNMLLNLYLQFVLVITYSLNIVLVSQAQNDNPPGYISIDCGLPEGYDYKDTTTGIYYKSDADSIDSGESQSILPSSNNPQQKYLSTLRSFPLGNRNCYTLQPSPGKGNKYLIRASFLYGNYDNKNQLPSFNLNLGVDIWDNINIRDQSTPVVTEVIHNLYSDYIHICLVKTGSSTPFISALELRPLISGIYTESPGSLQNVFRVNFDTQTTQIIRYKDDIYDRTWTPFTSNTSNTIGTSFNISNGNGYQIPDAVMRTAITPDNTSNPLRFYWAANASEKFYIYTSFAEVQKLEANQSREFNIYINDLLQTAPPVVPPYLRNNMYSRQSALTGSTRYNVTLQRTKNSTLPPIINAFEAYIERQFSNLQTDETDVTAILGIKSTYGVTRDWQGDPCEPQEFLWNGLNCSYTDSDSARIISLNLSKSTLTGEVASSIGNLTNLKTLDLSNNNLSGTWPDFLSQLDLRVLNLKGNNFTGPIPSQLLERQKNGILLLSFDGPGNNTDADTCLSQPCKKKGNKSALAVVAAVIASVIFLAVILFGIWMKRIIILQVIRKLIHKTPEQIIDMEIRSRRFTYPEVMNCTKNLQRVLGKGGFGTVYHGYVGDIPVAVKMLSESSTQGYREFETEVTVLMNVHHRNLTSLVGYCNEGTNQGIIYEYMANRSLHEHLSVRGDSILSWEIRLQIAIDAAHGLEYLHHGCAPAIIHRDIKTSNILLNEKFQAKLADFGLSRAYTVAGGSHISTVVAGTPGYLDPDYAASNRLTEKSDVYSFGIVVLVMITGRPPIMILRNQARTHITEWVNSIVRNGDVIQIVDPIFRGDYDVTSVRKAVKLAMACASKNPTERPTMNTVVIDLEDCLAIEISRHQIGSITPTDFATASSNIT